MFLFRNIVVLVRVFINIAKGRGSLIAAPALFSFGIKIGIIEI